MAKSAKERKRVKRKTKRKKVKAKHSRAALTDKRWFLLDEAVYYKEVGNLERAVEYIRRAYKLNPKDLDVLREMSHIGHMAQNSELKSIAFTELYNAGSLHPELRLPFLYVLDDEKKYEEGIAVAEETLALFPQFKIRDKREKRKEVNRLK